MQERERKIRTGKGEKIRTMDRRAEAMDGKLGGWRTVDKSNTEIR